MNTDWIRTIHTAKMKLGLDDCMYRDLLRASAGVDSAKDIQQYGQYKRVMDACCRAGFTVQPGIWACTERQRGHILGLWATASQGGTLEDLRKFMERTTKVKTFARLVPKKASFLIVGLDALIKTRAGKNSDS